MFFRPKLFDALQGYTSERFFKDVGAGLTVGVVALPLAMAFAIASGLSPQAGLFTAIIAGFLISLLGGSRVQIGGPAGAFIVIVYGIVERHGVANLLIATAAAGAWKGVSFFLREAVGRSTSRVLKARRFMRPLMSVMMWLGPDSKVSTYSVFLSTPSWALTESCTA